ncbi:hypothetical protein MTO96_015421 [Rhipicephalus appendiculatus]
MCMSWCETLRLRLIRGDQMKADARVPPSHRVVFAPRKGQLKPRLAWLPHGKPPLSLLNTIIELSSMRSCCSASRTSPTDWSNASIIPAQIVVRCLMGREA